MCCLLYLHRWCFWVGGSGWANTGLQLVNERDHNMWPWPHSSHRAEMKSCVASHGRRSTAQRRTAILIWYRNKAAFFPKVGIIPSPLHTPFEIEFVKFANWCLWQQINYIYPCVSPRVDCGSTYFPLWAFNCDDGFVYFLITMGMCLAVPIYASITLFYCLDIPGKFIFL